MSATLTPRQRELVRHAIGLDGRHKTTSRNHFCTGPGSDDYEEWENMVRLGLAKKGTRSPITGMDDVYWVTRETALAVREKDEHLSRDFRP